MQGKQLLWGRINRGLNIEIWKVGKEIFQEEKNETETSKNLIWGGEEKKQKEINLIEVEGFFGNSGRSGQMSRFLLEVALDLESEIK